MNQLKQHALTFLTASIGMFLLAGNAAADHSSRVIVGEDAKQLNCLAGDMHDEIKAHFKGVKGYGKLIGLNARVRAKSAAIVRRTKRDPCYRGLERDLRKLSQATCEFTELFGQVVRSGHCKIAGNLFHVEQKLGRMNQLTSIMVSVFENGIVIVPEYSTPVLNIGEPVGVELQAPILETYELNRRSFDMTPSSPKGAQSVLER